MKEEDHNCFMWLRTRGRKMGRKEEERHERARGQRPSRDVKIHVIRLRITGGQKARERGTWWRVRARAHAPGGSET